VNIVFEIIKYHWNAKGRHGIHSPFVYDLIDNCFTLKMNSIEKEQLKQFEHQLKYNHTLIDIEDFGVGSKRLGRRRKISSIYKTSSSRGKYGKLLFQLSRHYNFNNILELGTSLGIGTYHLHLGNQRSNITSIEACKETWNCAENNLGKFKNIQLIQSTFDHFLQKNSDKKFDFIFVDGHHDGEALLHYMQLLKSHSHNDTIFLLDDIRWSNSMFEAWNKIKTDNEYHLTIDLFRMGLVIPRSQQQKEHFTLSI
jgi:predicted O-methyltransferase YrrM